MMEDFEDFIEEDTWAEDLYEALQVEDGEAVYLSDGMWLHPDGSIRDDPY